MPGSLPAELTSFVGRRDELTDARRLLAGSRVLTMTGPGGVGKTRLALRFARQVRRSWRDGVFYADLSTIDDAALLPHTLAAVLGLHNSTGDAARWIVEYLADKKALLILDTCEHLTKACATLASQIMAAAPDVRLLATSRHVLAIDGEQIFPIAPLPVADAAVLLFADRASAVDPEFVVDDRNRDRVNVICRMLDGIPLAIELAAARLRALSLDEIRVRLDDRFRLLSGRDAATPNRQQTLAATLDWSHELCSPEEQLLWGRVSVFPGGFTLDAAEEVATGDGVPRAGVLDGVAGLVDKSVLFRTDDGPDVRYRMLDTVRQYGQRKLADSGSYTSTRMRQRDYYIRLVREMSHLWSGRHQLAAYTKIRSEHANIRAVLEFSLTLPDGSALRLAAYLDFYWICCGVLEEGRQWLTQALATGGHSARARGVVLWTLSLVAALQGDAASSRRLAAECEAVARDADDERALAAAMFVGAYSSFAADEPDSASLLSAAIERLESVAPSNLLAIIARASLAMETAMRGQADEASSIALAALAICERSGEQWVRSYAFYALALAQWVNGDFRQAAVHAELGLELAQIFHDITSASLLLELLAWIAVSQGEYERAAQLFGVADQVWALVGGRGLMGSDKWTRPRELLTSQARTVLGEDAYEAGVGAGAALAPDAKQAIRFALGKKPETGGRAAGAAVSPLTKREQQVAGLVAAGLTSREIAARLGISPHTADVHVNRILAKLGFTSRTQVAAWVASSE